MLPIPPAKSGNSARADELGTRSAVASPRFSPLPLKVVGSSQETRQDLRTTLRRQVGEPPRLDATFADVSPIPASSKDATPRKRCDSNSPFAATPNADCAGRVPTVPIPTSLFESLVAANTAFMSTIISNRDYVVHKKGFDSFSPPITEASKRNLRRQRSRKKAKLNSDSSPSKPHSAKASEKVSEANTPGSQYNAQQRVISAFPSAKPKNSENIGSSLGLDGSASFEDNGNPTTPDTGDSDDTPTQPSSVSAPFSTKRWATPPTPRPLTNISATQMNVRSPLAPDDFERARALAHRPFTLSGITPAQLMDVALAANGFPRSRTVTVYVPIAAPPPPPPERIPGWRSHHPPYRTPSARNYSQHAKPAEARPLTPPPAPRHTRQRTNSGSPFGDRHISVSPPPHRTPARDTLSPPSKTHGIKLDWTSAARRNLHRDPPLPPPPPAPLLNLGAVRLPA